MMSQLVQFKQHAFVTAAETYGTSGLSKWIKDNVISIVILVLGISILFAARNGNISKGVTILGGTLLGLVVLGMATGNTADSIGTFLIGLIKGS